MARRAVTPNRIKAFRDAQGWSAYEMACKLNCTRSYIKSLEGGSLPITHRFAVRYAVLERQTYAESIRRKQIQSLYPLPRQLKILARARRCRICRDWFIFPFPQQRVCPNTQCQSAARRARHARAHRR